MTVNKATLIGNLGRDAEIRTTNGGTQVATLRLATTDRQKNQSGEWVDHTEWHSVVCFGKLAELMDRFGKKGKQLYVEGRIQTREYTDKDGNKRWSTEIVASEIRLLGGARDDAGQSPGTSGPAGQTRAPARDDGGRTQTQRAPNKPAAQAPTDDYGSYGDDGLPF
jgi:single-strand DNA-binding protein